SSPDPSAPAISILSLHDALPISRVTSPGSPSRPIRLCPVARNLPLRTQPSPHLKASPGPQFPHPVPDGDFPIRSCEAKTEPHDRSEEHTSELQSLAYIVCRLLLE